MDDLVSVITPCYNGEKYVNDFLKSVLNQSYSNIELIFVDDGSTDDTKSIVESYREKFLIKGYQLIYIYQENKGQASAINKGLKLFKGKYLMWIDSDDIMLPSNVADKVNFLDRNPDCGFVIGKGVCVKSDNIDKPVCCIQRISPEGEDSLFEDLIMGRNVVFCPGVIMARREAILRSIPTLEIYESREGQNWQLMLPLAYHYKCGYLDKVVFKCVEHSDSHSRMKRTYRQWIERFNNFEDLLINTIVNIPDIKNQDTEKYTHLVREKYLQQKLLYACMNYDFHNSRLYKKEIVRNGYKSIKYDTVFKYFIMRVVRRLSRCLRNDQNKK